MSQRFERIRTVFLVALGLSLVTSPGAFAATIPDATTVLTEATATAQQTVGTGQGIVTARPAMASVDSVTAATAEAASPAPVKVLSRPVKGLSADAKRTVRSLKTVAGGTTSKARALTGTVVKQTPVAGKPVRRTAGGPSNGNRSRGSGGVTGYQPRISAKARSASGGSGHPVKRSATSHRRSGSSGASAGEKRTPERGTHPKAGTSEISSFSHSERARPHRQPAAGPSTPDVPAPTSPPALHAFGGAASSALLLTSALFGLLASFALAPPGIRRAIGPRAAAWRPLGLATALEQPG